MNRRLTRRWKAEEQKDEAGGGLLQADCDAGVGLFLAQLAEPMVQRFG